MSESIRYEDAAEERSNITGWVCKKCKRYWGSDKHMASYCCATDFPCECGKRREKSYLACAECRAIHKSEKWAKLYAEKAKPWDGETPLGEYNNDQFYWEIESLFDAFVDSEEDDLREWLEGRRLVFCTPNNGRHFDMNEYFYDDLAEDHEIEGCAEVEKAVNDFIASKAPLSWTADGAPITVESLLEILEPWWEDYKKQEAE